DSRQAPKPSSSSDSLSGSPPSACAPSPGWPPPSAFEDGSAFPQNLHLRRAPRTGTPSGRNVVASETVTVPSTAPAPAKAPRVEDRIVIARRPVKTYDRGVDPKPARQKAVAALVAVGLKDVPMKKPAELSGGQQQRVAIARALVNEPDIVFADEPTGNLDTETSREVVGLMKRLHKEKGLTFIIVTHDAAVGNQTERVILMRNGVILKSVHPTTT